MGNARKVNGHTVYKDVPSDAKFTDTTYSFLNAFPQAGQLRSETTDQPNFNNYTYPGQYLFSLSAYLSNSSNCPRKVAGKLIVTASLQNDQSSVNPVSNYYYCTQLWLCYDGYIYVRRGSTANKTYITWSNWSFIPNSAQTDQVIYSGISGRWNSIKYNNGFAITYRIDHLDEIGVKSAWGSSFTSGVDTIAPKAYPFSFTSKPVEIVSVSSGNTKKSAWLICSETANTTSATGGYELARGTSNTADAMISYIVCGNWK